MLVYTAIMIKLHGLYRSDLKGLTREQIAKKVQELLLPYFEYESDVEIELTESAGE